MGYMTPEDIKKQEQQRHFRTKLADMCQQEGWSLHDVFYSDVEYYVHKDLPKDRKWHNQKKGKPPSWVKTHGQRMHAVIEGPNVVEIDG